MRLRRRLALLVVAWILGSFAAVPCPLQAQEEPEAGHGNHIALFVGVTDEEAETAFTLGLDYERRLSPRFGIGLLVDNEEILVFGIDIGRGF